MLVPIVEYPHPILRTKCAPVNEETPEQLTKLAEDMLETMYEAQGIGLAAPQIALELQFAVIDVTEMAESVTLVEVNGKKAELADLMPLIFYNPEIEGLGKSETAEEGCLSIPDFRAPVRRPSEVRAQLNLLNGSSISLLTNGILARALQHEIDHLRGVLFLDRLSAAQKALLKKSLRELKSRKGGVV